MRFCYADPPYLGCSRRYPEHPDAKRWDDPAAHGDLMQMMDVEYDGWALSASSSSLQSILPLAPPKVRVAAWVKPVSAPFPTVRVGYAWEPVIYRPGRPLTRDSKRFVRDFLIANMAMRRGVIGAKPSEYCAWVLDLLSVERGDEVADLFPGSGIMTVAARWRRLHPDDALAEELADLMAES